MSKQSFIWGGIALVAVTAAAVWVGISVLGPDDANRVSANGPSLRVDVVAPKEPEPLANGSPLSVGELANSYNHEDTVTRVASEPEPSQDEYGSSWNDDNWTSAGGVGDSERASAPSKVPADKTVKVTKVPEGFQD